MFHKFISPDLKCEARLASKAGTLEIPLGDAPRENYRREEFAGSFQICPESARVLAAGLCGSSDLDQDDHWTGFPVDPNPTRIRNNVPRGELDFEGAHGNQEIPSMCDYSLHAVKSRAAQAGDRLATSSFAYTSTRGFSALDEPGVAVCLRPGTELAFENDIKWGHPLSMLFRKRKAGRLVRFRQINTERAAAHHDAIEFPNGEVVLLTDLRPGQKATVIQLPVSEAMMEHEASNASVIDLVPTQGPRPDRSEWFFAG